MLGVDDSVNAIIMFLVRFYHSHLLLLSIVVAYVVVTFDGQRARTLLVTEESTLGQLVWVQRRLCRRGYKL